MWYSRYSKYWVYLFGTNKNMRKLDFANNHYYHIYNRGADKRIIFEDNGDYVRFIHYLYELNDTLETSNLSRSINTHLNEGGEASFIKHKREREKLVNIICFCLMPNHYHLILEQLVEGGISKFMQKLGTAYTMFFNTKYKRSGVLFQGVFKAILIDSDGYLLQLFRYIHLNPLEKIGYNVAKNIKDWHEANNFLESFKWSSYLDYINKNNFPSVTSRDFINKFFPSAEKHQYFINQFTGDDYHKVKSIIIE